MRHSYSNPNDWALMPSHAAQVQALAAGAYQTARHASPPAVRGKVAILQLFGILTQRGDERYGGTSTDAFGRAFTTAIREPSIKAVVLDVDSPGGTVPGTEELSALIYSARGKKPVIAVANSLAASAAYWASSAAGEFVAIPSADVGSIGVFSMHVDESGANEKAGYAVTLVSAGRYKVEGNPFAPLSPDARAEMQRRADAIHRTFVLDVARNRGVSTGTVAAGFGQGRVLRSGAALAERMIDRVATLDDVLDGLGTSRPVGFAHGIDASLTRMLVTAWGQSAAPTANVDALRRRMRMRELRRDIEGGDRGAA